MDLKDHGEALASWFESDQNPQWSPFWVMPYVGFTEWSNMDNCWTFFNSKY